MSVGSGRYCFKRTADFETGRKGGWGWRWSGKGTQPPLITAQPPSLLQDACSARQRPHPRPGGCARAHLAFSGRPPRRGIPPRGRAGICGQQPRFVSGGVALRRSPARPFSPVRAVTRSPISWWILLKRPRSRSRTKAIVLFPPSGSASLPECPFLYNYFHCVRARLGVAGGGTEEKLKKKKKALCLSVYLRDGTRGGDQRLVDPVRRVLGPRGASPAAARLSLAAPRPGPGGLAHGPPPPGRRAASPPPLPRAAFISRCRAVTRAFISWWLL